MNLREEKGHEGLDRRQVVKETTAIGRKVRPVSTLKRAVVVCGILSKKRHDLP